MVRDTTLDQLLELHDQKYDLTEDGEYRVEFHAWRVDPTEHIPQGVRYALCLHGPDTGAEDDSRVICFDNAHAITTRGPTPPPVAWDHKHRLRTISAYEYQDAAQLVADFWAATDQVLKERGIAQ